MIVSFLCNDRVLEKNEDDCIKYNELLCPLLNYEANFTHECVGLAIFGPNNAQFEWLITWCTF